MIRTQIQFTKEQMRHLRLAAHQQGASIAAVVRGCVDNALLDQVEEQAARYERAFRLLGAFHDSKCANDLSCNHDHYLDEAFERHGSTSTPPLYWPC